MDFTIDSRLDTRRRALNMLRLLKVAASQPLTSVFVSGYLGLGMSAARTYLSAATDAGALIRTGSYRSVEWIPSGDKAKTSRFIEKLTKDSQNPDEIKPFARDMRCREAEKQGRHIHYIDKGGQGSLEEVKPVACDPFDALFFSKPQVTA